jgi:hypothetical protein
MTAHTESASNDPRWPRSDEDLYVAVTKAWCRTLTGGERRKWPLSPYVFGRGFVRSVAESRANGLQVALACARLARRHTGQRERGQSVTLEPAPRDALDWAAAWWYALDVPDGLGVHYVELGGGTIEFISVSYRNDRPDAEGPSRG